MVEENRVVAVRVVLERTQIEQARLAAHLSNAENDRMARFRYPDDRRRYLVAHGVLRDVLAEMTGVAAASLRFMEGPHGKPFLDPPGLKFNLSHSGELAMAVMSADREVGVDIEKHRPDIDVLAIAHRYFAPEEAARLAALPIERRNSAFFTLWTRKEAYSKARGIALAPALREPAPREEASGKWGVEEIAAGEGYSAAIAYGLDPPFLRPNSNRRPRIILTSR
jgi:4'-phosphopantetheinyl transferase